MFELLFNNNDIWYLGPNRPPPFKLDTDSHLSPRVKMALSVRPFLTLSLGDYALRKKTKRFQKLGVESTCG